MIETVITGISALTRPFRYPNMDETKLETGLGKHFGFKNPMVVAPPGCKPRLLQPRIQLGEAQDAIAHVKFMNAISGLSVLEE